MQFCLKYNTLGIHSCWLFKGRPDIPRSVTLTCEGTSSILKWISSFNGRERQTFIVVTFNVQYGTIYSERIPDKGENTVHSYFIDNLQPSTLYLFYVSAENRHGKSSSENKSCTTRKQGNNFFLFDLRYQTCFLNINNFAWLKGNSNEHTYVLFTYICLFNQIQAVSRQL